MIQRFRRRLHSSALVPMLIWMLSGSYGSGGWYCADGSQCKPPAAATCCCGDQQFASDDCCAADHAHARITASDLACGCYYQLLQTQTLETRLESMHLAAAFAPALPASFAELSVPNARFVCIAVPADAHGPPRLLDSSRITRGPPTA